MDIHQKEVQGFFNCPVDNLRASPFLIQYIKESVIVLSFYLALSLCIESINVDSLLDSRLPQRSDGGSPSWGGEARDVVRGATASRHRGHPRRGESG